MKIALLGFGNMGQEIQELVEYSNHEITSISYKNIKEPIDEKGILKSDVVIDFTSPEIVLSNIKAVLKLKKPIVVGTTGWYGDIEKVKKIVKENKGSFIYGQNFSIGANIFFNLIEEATKQISRYEEYDVFGLETHHIGKVDSPSGTARKLGEIIIKNNPRKSKLQVDKLDRKIKKDELHFASIRGGRNFGKHEIIFDSPADEIRLSHQAWGRAGFAKGALVAAEFIVKNKGFYNFVEIINYDKSKKGGENQ